LKQGGRWIKSMEDDDFSVPSFFFKGNFEVGNRGRWEVEERGLLGQWRGAVEKEAEEEEEEEGPQVFDEREIERRGLEMMRRCERMEEEMGKLWLEKFEEMGGFTDYILFVGSHTQRQPEKLHNIFVFPQNRFHWVFLNFYFNNFMFLFLVGL